MDNIQTPAEEQVKEPQEEVVVEEVVVEEPEEAKVEQVPLEDMIEEKRPDVRNQDSVPLAAHLELKRELKALQKTINKTQQSDVSLANSDISSIANEYGVDKDFVSKLANAIQTNTQKEVEAKYAPILERQEAERRAEKMEALFDKVFEQSIKENPDYAKIANKGIIKSLAFNPANSKKTVVQILEEAYGNSIPTKPSIETARPAPNKQDKVDFDSMNAEEASAASIDPSLKGEYANWLIKKGMI